MHSHRVTLSCGLCSQSSHDVSLRAKPPSCIKSPFCVLNLTLSTEPRIFRPLWSCFIYKRVYALALTSKEQSWMYITVHSQSFLEELVLSESRSDLLSVRILKTRGAFTASSMKPLPIAILLTAILLTTHLPLRECRARGLRVVDDRGFKQQLDEVLLQAEDSAVSYLLGAKLLQYLQQRKPEAHRSATFIQPISAGLGLRPGQGLGPGLGAEAPEKGRWREDEDASQEELVGFSKRNEEPPISIDLTFHLLRNMIEMARIENQREQAELNRKYLDEVGK